MRDVIRKSSAILAILSSVALFTGCFTGVESTKTVTMSRKDVKLTSPTAEEVFINEVKPSPLGEWEIGKKLVVADDRLALLLIQRSLPSERSKQPAKGDTLYYVGTRPENHPDGRTTLAIVLTGKNQEYLLDTNLSSDTAIKDYNSSSMEALIDLDMIDALREKMDGKTLWTRSSLWYDKKGEDFHGSKYIPVKITGIEPGNMVFPVEITFIGDDSVEGRYMMSMWKGSRSFPTLFYLYDVKKLYPRIAPEKWELICQGKVSLGMTKQECKLSMGNPLDSDSGRTYSSTVDLWMYDGGRYLKFEDGLLIDFRQ